MSYIGQRYLAGNAESLKEYNIALDVLGRPADFDTKRDSIVRVEAHRLRKKLKAYYGSEARDHTLELVLEPGCYTPRFVARIIPEETPAAELAPSDAPVSSEMHFGGRKGSWGQLREALAAVCVLLGGVGAFATFQHKPLDDPQTIRFLVSPGRMVDGLGQLWLGEQWHSGGELLPSAIPPFELDGSASRWWRREGDFEYAIPLRHGTYELRLFFIASDGAPLTRRFHVFANGVQLIDGADPEMARPADEVRMTRVFRDLRPAADGKLHLAFRRGADKAHVAAIELTEGIPGHLRPIRIATRNAPVTSSDGRVWGGDRYVQGGHYVGRRPAVRGHYDPNLFTSERYGDFTYRIPVAPGSYRLSLYMAETWFGPQQPGGGGIGSRRFDVSANGNFLLHNFDLFQSAGGSGVGIARVFPGLQPGADGYITLRFQSIVNQACVNALELVSEP